MFSTSSTIKIPHTGLTRSSYSHGTGSALDRFQRGPPTSPRRFQEEIWPSSAPVANRLCGGYRRGDGRGSSAPPPRSRISGLSAAPLTRSGGAAALFGGQKWLRRRHRCGYHRRAAVRAADWCGGRGQQISARFSGRTASVVWARISEISAVVVAAPLRDLGLLFFSCLLPAAFSVPCWLSGADPEWLQQVAAS